MVESNFHKQKTPPIDKPSSKEPVPEKIGPYKVEALLEKGGMSFLYLATHPETKDPITIKVLFPEFLSNPEMVQRFLREAAIIALGRSSQYCQIIWTRRMGRGAIILPWNLFKEFLLDNIFCIILFLLNML